MKVALHVGQLLQPIPGGIGRYTEALGAALPAAGAEVVGFGAGPLPARRRATFPDYVDLGWPSAPIRYELWHRLRRPALPLTADIVHAPSLAIPPAGTAPLVVTVHDVAFLRHPEAFTRRGLSFHRRGLELAYHEATAIVTASEFSLDELRRSGFESGRVHLAPHGVRAPEPEPDDLVETRLRRVGIAEPYVLCVGTIEPRKGLDLLVEAFTDARAVVPELSLALVGQRGWLSSTDLTRPGISELGRVDEATLDALYRRAAMCAVPSRYEGFGLPALEAMARGAPVVASDSTSLPEVVGDAGILLSPLDVGAWSKAMFELVHDEPKRLALGARGRERSALFTWEASARAHLAVYSAAAGVQARP